MADPTGLKAADFRRETGKGLLRDELFPSADGTGSTLVEDLEGSADAGDDDIGWIAQGESKTEYFSDSNTRRQAVEAFVYYRAFFDVYQRMSADPTATDLPSGQGSIEWNWRQADRFEKLANDYKRKFDVLTSAEREVPETTFGPPRSSTADTKIYF